jgi:hypothetical protein
LGKLFSLSATARGPLPSHISGSFLPKTSANWTIVGSFLSLFIRNSLTVWSYKLKERTSQEPNRFLCELCSLSLRDRTTKSLNLIPGEKGTKQLIVPLATCAYISSVLIFLPLATFSAMLRKVSHQYPILTLDKTTTPNIIA